MSEKYNLPRARNPRQELTLDADGKVIQVTEVQTENKNQVIIEKQNLERIKNAGTALKLMNNIIDIIKIKNSGKAQVDIIEARIRETESEARAYIDKINAETSQYIVKGQITTSIIQAISDMINQNPELNDIVKLEAIKNITSLVNTTLESKQNDQ